MVADLKAAPFVPMTGEKLVPESAITDALMEQEFARMADWGLEHRDEIRAQYEEAQAGWDRMDFPRRSEPQGARLKTMPDQFTKSLQREVSGSACLPLLLRRLTAQYRGVRPPRTRL